MNFMNDLAILYNYALHRSLRNGFFVVINLLQPLLYLLLFLPILNNMDIAALGGSDAINVFLPGILVLLIFSATSGEGFNTLNDLQSGLLERLRVTPASRLALLVAPILATLTMQIAALTLLIAIAIPLGFDGHIGGLAITYVLLLLLGFMVASLAVLLALKLKTMMAYGSIVNMANLPIMLLSGILLPLSLAPGWMQAIAHFNPLFYVIEAVRQLVAGALTASEVVWAFVIVTGLLVVTLGGAIRSYRKAVA